MHSTTPSTTVTVTHTRQFGSCTISNSTPSSLVTPILHLTSSGRSIKSFAKNKSAKDLLKIIASVGGVFIVVIPNFASFIEMLVINADITPKAVAVDEPNEPLNDIPDTSKFKTLTETPWVMFLPNLIDNGMQVAIGAVVVEFIKGNIVDEIQLGDNEPNDLFPINHNDINGWLGTYIALESTNALGNICSIIHKLYQYRGKKLNLAARQKINGENLIVIGMKVASFIIGAVAIIIETSEWSGLIDRVKEYTYDIPFSQSTRPRVTVQYRLHKPLKYNLFFGAHNSFASTTNGYHPGVANQELSIHDQLLLGARYFKIEVELVESNFVLYHGDHVYKDTWLTVAGLGAPRLTLRSYLQPILDFLGSGTLPEMIAIKVQFNVRTQADEPTLLNLGKLLHSMFSTSMLLDPGCVYADTNILMSSILTSSRIMFIRDVLRTTSLLNEYFLYSSGGPYLFMGGELQDPMYTCGNAERQSLFNAAFVRYANELDANRHEAGTFAHILSTESEVSWINYAVCGASAFGGAKIIGGGNNLSLIHI